MQINFWAVLAAVVAQTVLGMLWYGPLFGKRWMALNNITEEDMNALKLSGKPQKSMAIGVVNSFIVMYVLAIILNLIGADTLAMAIQYTALIWLGFIATFAISGVLYEKQPFALFSIHVLYQLASLLAGAILLVLIG